MLSLVEMQLSEKHKENFDVSSEGSLRLELQVGGRENDRSFYTEIIKASRDKNKPIRWI